MPRPGILTRLATATKLRRFGKDERGMAMTEFAVAAPFILAVWLGTVTFADLQTVSNNTSQVAATVSDIIAQGTTVSTERAQAAFSIADAVIPASSTVSLYVAGLKIVDGEPIVEWSYSNRSGGAPSVGSVHPINGSTNLTMGVDFIVTAGAKVTHTPAFALAVAGPQTYEYASFNVPRNGGAIVVEQQE